MLSLLRRSARHATITFAYIRFLILLYGPITTSVDAIFGRLERHDKYRRAGAPPRNSQPGWRRTISRFSKTGMPAGFRSITLPKVMADMTRAFRQPAAVSERQQTRFPLFPATYGYNISSRQYIRLPPLIGRLYWAPCGGRRRYTYTFDFCVSCAFLSAAVRCARRRYRHLRDFSPPHILSFHFLSFLYRNYAYATFSLLRCYLPISFTLRYIDFNDYYTIQDFLRDTHYRDGDDRAAPLGRYHAKQPCHDSSSHAIDLRYDI